ncbi:hypothetical protein GTCCBUS3UF5_38750 [Geobacillus thermoleovorans CCB_US3_UF5]|uniref:Uncharacterized protein n=3 Tax=Geobacillus TaxID=129337 RepID=A0A7U9JFF2_GEOTM|nr:hypothetical protein GTCCBUS3UF5_38750 [Geobacillus thermoleovorans CCB_US3_UF5]ESU73916.1 hypothetical protein T260_00745 [Geobacillus sp. MAS1]GAD13253.1 hypothetical protein GBL_1470 [Geobacillus kaustophilus GBlys]GAJ57066.1 hypothetical protein B23_0255 [Geobacillus thermoleovorans B23]
MIEQFVTNVLLIYELFRSFVSNIFNFDMVETKENAWKAPKWLGQKREDR